MSAAAIPFDHDRFDHELRLRLPEVFGPVRKGLRGKLRGWIATLAGFSNAVENKVLDHLTGKTAYASPAPLYMALVTSAVGEADTSATLVEATYTGYARKQVPAADWNAASAGVVATAVQEAFAACTGGSSTILGWALSPVAATAGAGDVVMYGTTASVQVTVTQTPPQVAAGALSMSLD